MQRLHRTLTVFFALLLVTAVQAQPRHLYLTWDNPDTAHTQTVVFQTVGRAENPKVEVHLSGPDKPASNLQAHTVMLSNGRRIHSLTLKDLKPSTTYRFRAGDTTYGMSPWRNFRTLPSDGRPLKIATGGDMYRHTETVTLLKAAANYKPEVALIGGDLAYADGDLSRIGFWDDWLDNWSEDLESKGGPMVGIIAAVGNHETQGAFDQSKSAAPLYYALLPQGGTSYFTRRLGKNAEVVVLDTSHTNHHKDQVPFLKSALQSMEKRDVPLRIALYHVPTYPSHRPYEDEFAVRGRQFWVPLFDQYHLTLALENHDHVFKRTFPLKGGKVVENGKGTVYLGDGCWGRTPRTVTAKHWYHVKASPTNHFWVLTQKDAGLLCEAVGLDGKVFDKTTVQPINGGN